MKEKIYTIPVNDAYLSDAACPLCQLEHTTEQSLLDYYLGAAIMEPDVRVETNKKGFCCNHWGLLYKREDNRLGLGLLLHTHVEDLCNDLNSELTATVPGVRKNIFSGKDKNYKQKLETMATKIESRTKSCIICERIKYTMERYLDVIFHQFFHEPAFKQYFESKKGYCLPHLAMLLKEASQKLNQEEASVFLNVLACQQNESLETLRDDVEWFTLKFDYRNTKADWKNSKDALPRAIDKISGKVKD